MPNFDIARESVGTLVSDFVTADRFVKWKTTLVPGAAGILGRYAFGEIFWRKSLGRPSSAALSDGFWIEAWRDETILVGSIGGPLREQVIRAPYFPSLWDGKDDGHYWRVVYMIPNMASTELAAGSTADPDYTHIVPHFNRDVAWTGSSSPLGLIHLGPRNFTPSRAVFVKGDAPVHFSFEIERQPILVSP